MDQPPSSPKGDRGSALQQVSTVEPPSSVGRPSTVQRTSFINHTLKTHQASSFPQARTQPTSFISGVNQTQHQFQQRGSHLVPSAQHPSKSNIMKTSYLGIAKTQRHVQLQKQRNFYMALVPPVPQQNFEIVQQKQLAVLDRPYFTSRQAGPMQLAGSPVGIPQNWDTGEQRLNTFDAAGLPLTIMQPQRVHQMQTSLEDGNIRSTQGLDWAEGAMRNAGQLSPLQCSTHTSSEQGLTGPSQNPTFVALLGSRRGGLQDQPFGGQPQWRQEQVGGQPIEQCTKDARQIEVGMALLSRQFPQVPGIRSASEGAGQNLPSIHPTMICGDRTNPFPAQQLRNAPVQTPPSLIVAQDIRLASKRSRGKSLEAASGYHGQDQRGPSSNPVTSQVVASRAHSEPQQKCSMAPPVTPTAGCPRLDAFGSTNHARLPQKIGQQAPCALANTGHPVSVLHAAEDANSNLQQPQHINQQPDGVLLLPGQYTPIPTPFPYAVSSSPTQGEQSGMTTPQPGTIPGFKTRITIAISGCPASGKSTLAYLLAAVFEGTSIRGTGFAGAQSLYPQFNGRVEENPNRKGPISKVIIIHQNSYIKPIDEWPKVQWTELYPYTPAMEVMNPQIDAALALAEERGHRAFERYWEEAYKANIGVDPSLVSNPSGSSFPQIVSPSPLRISKEGPNLDCRGAIAWKKFGKAINDGMRGHKNEEGILETEEGRNKVASYLSQPHPETNIPLVNSRKIESLRARIREWIREETAQNDRIGFPGRSVVNGSLRQIFILDGSLLFLQTDPNKGAGGERLMKACDVKLFLPTLEKEAIQRCFSQMEYMDPPRGTRKPEQTWMYEGYFSEVAW